MALGVPFGRVTLDNYIRKWKPEAQGGPIYSILALPGQLLLAWQPLYRDHLDQVELRLPLSPELLRVDPIPGFFVSATKEMDSNGIPLAVTSRMTLQSALQSIHTGYRTWAPVTSDDPRLSPFVHTDKGVVFARTPIQRDRPDLIQKLIRASIVPWVHASCIVHVILSCSRVQSPWKRLQPTLVAGEQGNIAEKVINAQDAALRSGHSRCPPPFSVMSIRDAEKTVGARYDQTFGRLVKTYTSKLREVSPSRFSDENEPEAVDAQGRVQAAWVRLLAARYLQLVDTLIEQERIPPGLLSTTREAVLRSAYPYLNGPHWNIVVNAKDISSAGLTQEEVMSTALSGQMVDQISIIATRVRTPRKERIEGLQ
jgi:hypothetical protein